MVYINNIDCYSMAEIPVEHIFKSIRLLQQHEETEDIASELKVMLERYFNDIEPDKHGIKKLPIPESSKISQSFLLYYPNGLCQYSTKNITDGCSVLLSSWPHEAWGNPGNPIPLEKPEKEEIKQGYSIDYTPVDSVDWLYGAQLRLWNGTPVRNNTHYKVNVLDSLEAYEKYLAAPDNIKAILDEGEFLAKLNNKCYTAAHYFIDRSYMGRYRQSQSFSYEEYIKKNGTNPQYYDGIFYFLNRQQLEELHYVVAVSLEGQNPWNASEKVRDYLHSLKFDKVSNPCYVDLSDFYSPHRQSVKKDIPTIMVRRYRGGYETTEHGNRVWKNIPYDDEEVNYISILRDKILPQIHRITDFTARKTLAHLGLLKHSRKWKLEDMQEIPEETKETGGDNHAETFT